MSGYFWNSDPQPPVTPPGTTPPGGTPGTGHGPRWLGPPYRIGPGGQGLPPQFQATQDWLMGLQHTAPSASGNPGAGIGWEIGGAPHSPLTNVTGGSLTSTMGGYGNPALTGGPTGPPTPFPGGGTPPPWWQAFQQYAGQRFPWLRGLGAGGARNWFGPPPTTPPAGPYPGGTGTPYGGGGAHGAY